LTVSVKAVWQNPNCARVQVERYQQSVAIEGAFIGYYQKDDLRLKKCPLGDTIPEIARR
jgi:hypothetical protein